LNSPVSSTLTKHGSPMPSRLALVVVAESKAYVHFVNPASSDWQFHSNLQLESPTEGFVVLDILDNHRVGGVEFVDKI
jgi:hypothetical protein